MRGIAPVLFLMTDTAKSLKRLTDWRQKSFMAYHYPLKEIISVKAFCYFQLSMEREIYWVFWECNL